MNFLYLGLGAIPFFFSGILPQGAPVYLTVLGFLLGAVLAYLLGSINSALLVSKALYRTDIREFGSGNAGLSNMYRVYGKGAAALTLCGDILKTILAVALSMLFVGYLGGYIAMLFCIIGHALPCFFRFRGGKGVLCAAAAIFCTCPLVFILLILIFLAMVATTKYVSVGSITAAFFYPMVQYAFFKSTPHPLLIIPSICACVLVIVLHRENIHRLRLGEERKFGDKELPDGTKVRRGKQK